MVRNGQGEEVSFLDLATLASAPYWARRFAGAVLAAWQVLPDAITTAELLVSELVTNAIQALAPESARLSYVDLEKVDSIRLTLRRLPGLVVIEVYDRDGRPPKLSESDVDAESGRGLMLVQACSKEWGHFFHPSGGKTVYAVLMCDQGRC